MKVRLVLLVVLLLAPVAIAAEPLLRKLESIEVPATALPGYSPASDQAFEIRAEPWRGQAFFFAGTDKSSDRRAPLPAFFVAKGKAIVDRQPLPTLEEGWDLVQVDAVSARPPNEKGGKLRLLAILLLEPASGRSSDYWQQPFVFEIDSNGKVDVQASLNAELASMQPRIVTLAALKKYLARRRARS